MDKRSVDVVVVSDIHLGTYGCKAKEIANYLKSITPQVLILNGDVIDAWQFSKSYFPASHLTVIKEIMNLLSNGTRVIYITGNHDEMLRRYSDLQIGNFQLTDKLVIEINNKMTWVFHGDVFDNTTKDGAKFIAKLGSSGYAFLIALNRIINRFLKMIGREKVSFSKKIMLGVNKAIVKMNVFEQTVAELAIEKKYDYVICGHIHQPEKKVVETINGKVTYLNSGDWVEHLTALEYQHDDWVIFTYDQRDFENVNHDELKTTLNVVTDEIHYYINSLAI